MAKQKREIIRGTETIYKDNIRNMKLFMWHSGWAYPLLQKSICVFNTDHQFNSKWLSLERQSQRRNSYTKILLLPFPIFSDYKD